MTRLSPPVAVAALVAGACVLAGAAAPAQAATPLESLALTVAASLTAGPSAQRDRMSESNTPAASAPAGWNAAMTRATTPTLAISSAGKPARWSPTGTWSMPTISICAAPGGAAVAALTGSDQSGVLPPGAPGPCRHTGRVPRRLSTMPAAASVPTLT
jgi:hypothetical protein